MKLLGSFEDPAFGGFGAFIIVRAPGGEEEGDLHTDRVGRCRGVGWWRVVRRWMGRLCEDLFRLESCACRCCRRRRRRRNDVRFFV